MSGQTNRVYTKDPVHFIGRGDFCSNACGASGRGSRAVELVTCWRCLEIARHDARGGKCARPYVHDCQCPRCVARPSHEIRGFNPDKDY